MIFLDLDECNVANVESLAFLDGLKTLRLKNNKIQSIENLEKTLMCMRQLETLNILGNPLVSTKKYRDKIVVAAGSLISLDGKKVTQQERDFIIALKHKKGMKTTYAKEKSKDAQIPELKGLALTTKMSYFMQQYQDTK